MKLSFSRCRPEARTARLAAPLVLALTLTPWAASAADWVNTATQAFPLGAAAGVVALPNTAALHIAVGLKPRDKAGLDSFIVAVNTPGNPAFGRFLSPQQFVDLYAPSAAQAQAVLDYLNSQGFTHVTLSANRTLVTADGSVAAVQKAFNTKLVQFIYKGQSLFANTAAAQVPSALGNTVSAVLGLHNLPTMQTLLAQAKAAGKQVEFPALGQPVPNDTVVAPANFTAAMFQSAYDVGTTPTGDQTVEAIVTEGDLTQIPKDLRQYETENKLPEVPYEIIFTGLPNPTDTAGTDEWDLDSQTSTGIAGNVKNLLLYDANSLADPDLIPAYEKIVSDNRAKMVNMSFGGCETTEYLSGGMIVADVQYEQGAAEGMTFFASSGDAGAACSVLLNLGVPLSGIPDVEYPASSPYVVAVGGTSLTTNADNSYNSEQGWDDSGGGTSLWETTEPWQYGVVPTGSVDTMVLGTVPLYRGVPDIAMEAGGQLVAATGGGAAIVVDGADTGVAGTSLSSPLAVGSWARMQSAHHNCYGFAAPIFYGFANGMLTAAKDFNDITLGTNGLFLATPGWDYVTGLGSFDIAKVSADLPTCPVVAAGGASGGNSTGTGGATGGATGGTPPASPVVAPSQSSTNAASDGRFGGALSGSLLMLLAGLGGVRRRLRRGT